MNKHLGKTRNEELTELINGINQEIQLEYPEETNHHLYDLIDQRVKYEVEQALNKRQYSVA